MGRAKQLFSNRRFLQPRALVIVASLVVVGLMLLFFAKAAVQTKAVDSEDGSREADCMGEINSSAASKQSAVRFGNCSPGLLGLDETGSTIPKTNYPIPSGAIYMATDGNDSNDGKAVTSAVKTLNAAIAKSVAGGTIVVRGGTYRDWYTAGGTSGPAIVSKSLTFQAYPNESPWFDGSDIVNSGWISDGQGHWYHAWETPSFCGGSYYSYTTPPYTPQRKSDGTTDTSVKQTKCMYEDASNDPKFPMAGDPQQVFVNNSSQQEVASIAQVRGGTFYYDWYARRIYIGTDPTSKQVELSARPSVMSLGGADSNQYTVRGIGFRRYATNGSEGTLTGGVIYFSNKTVLENSVFVANSTNAVAFSNPRNGTVIRNTVVAFNGGTGMTANGAASSGSNRNDFLIESSVFNSNNHEHGGTYCNRACGPSNIKMAHMTGFTAKNNVFENAVGSAHGLWCDLNCSDAIIVNNIARNNGLDGIFYEVSSKGIIASNLVYGNKGHGIRVGSATTKIYNNTLVNNAVTSMWIYDDSRTIGAGGWSAGQIGPDTMNIQVANNIMYGNSQSTLLAQNASGQTNPDNFMEVLDHNSYYRTSTSPILVQWLTSGVSAEYDRSLSTFKSAHPKYEINGKDNVGSTNPFNDMATKNYAIRTNSPEYQTGVSLPVDVATALGLSTSTIMSRGAIAWPGSQ